MATDPIRIHPSWREALAPAFEASSFEALRHFVHTEYTTHSILPEAKNIFRAFDLCPLDQVKVVILGQDPYPTRGHAHGLCFSVEPHVRPLPKSLVNVFNEIQTDLGTPMPAHGNLEHWAAQGVLLLNAILTVREGQPASHQNRGWEPFTDFVIQTVSDKAPPSVFMLWGAFAQSKQHLIDSRKHHILTAPHPSPLSTYRGFFGCRHFSRANQWLISQNRSAVRW